MEQRADELVDRARTANTPWLAQLGPEPTDPQDAAAWRERARTLVAYRERHQITDRWSALGTADIRNAQQRREESIAARFMTLPTRPRQVRSTSAPPLAARVDPIGR